MGQPHWKSVTLGDVLTPKSQRVKVSESHEYQNLGLYSYGRGAFEKTPISGKSTSAPALFQVQAGQFIYSRLFAFEGAFAVVPDHMDGWFVSNEYPTFDINQDLVLTSYLRAIMCRPSAWTALADMTVGMGHRRQRLHPDELLSFEITLPPIDEQHRIITAIRTVESGLSAARSLHVKSESFLESLRESLLVENGDWICRDDWRVLPLEDVCQVTLGFTKGRKLTGPTQEVPYLRAANVQDGFFKLDNVADIEACQADHDKYLLAPNDILLLEGGNLEHVGRAWIWGGEISTCLHQNSTIRARVRNEQECNPRFIAWALGATPAREFCLDEASQTSNVAHLGLAGARQIPVPLPPLDRQLEITRDLDVARRNLVSAIRKVQRYADMRADLIDALTSGQASI